MNAACIHYKAGSGYGVCLRSNTFNLLHECLFYWDRTDSVYSLFLRTLGKMEGVQFLGRMLSGLWLIQWWFQTGLAVGDRASLVLCQTCTASIISQYAHCTKWDDTVDLGSQQPFFWKYSNHTNQSAQKPQIKAVDMHENGCRFGTTFPYMHAIN